MSRYSCIAILLLISICTCHAQVIDTCRIDSVQAYSMDGNDAPNMIPSIPTSPQAEAFKRIGLYSVNNASGIPDICIPLLEFEHAGYKIPISMRYLATPIKPGYNYDVCGIGWGMTGSSCVSRVINSAPDEVDNFSISDVLGERYDMKKNNLYLYNLMPDYFDVTLPNGRSFSFSMRKYEEALEYIISEGSGIKISCSYDAKNIYSFTIVDEEGVKYTFADADVAYVPQNSFYSERNVSWYLSKIELPNSIYPIYYTYGTTIKTGLVGGIDEPCVYIAHNYNSHSDNKVYFRLDMENSISYFKMKLLTGISCLGHSVSFGYSDKSSESRHNNLPHITISDRDYTKVIKFSYDLTDLSYDHSIAPQLASLNRISIVGNGGNDSLVYKIVHSGIVTANGTDHWGNYSRYATNNSMARFNFFAEFSPERLFSTNVIKNIAKNSNEKCPYYKYQLVSLGYGSDDPRRTSNPNDHNILKEIVYPNGGKTVFSFDVHRFLTATSRDGDFIPYRKQRRITEGGGFRIKSITNYDSKGKVVDMRTYCYGPTNGEVRGKQLNLPQTSGDGNIHIGYGEPVVDPNILTYASFSTMTVPAGIRNMLLGYDQTGKNSTFENPFDDDVSYFCNPWFWECRFSASNFRRLLNNRPAVVYSQITEYAGDCGWQEDASSETIGKTVYHYDIYGRNDSVYIEPLYYDGNVLNCYEQPEFRNLLSKKEVFGYRDSKFVLELSEDYAYSSHSSSAHGYQYNNQYPSKQGDSQYATVKEFLTSSSLRFGSSLLSETKREENFYQSGSKKETERIFYANSYLPSVKEEKGRTTRYNYLIENDTTAVAQVARDRNQLNLPQVIKTATYYDFCSSGNKYEYGLFSFGNQKLLLPTAVYNRKRSSDNFYKACDILSYTPNGHPIEVIGQDGTHRVYLWSYNDRYLVCELANVTTQEVSEALQKQLNTNLSTFILKASVTETELEKIRSSELLQNASVKSWTYQPSVGVISETTPFGLTTYYAYDGLGRLKETFRYKDASKQNKIIIKQYDYNFSNK